MTRALRLGLAAAAMLLSIMAATAQQLPIIGNDPQFGPICAGPLGPGPCAAIQQYILQHAGQVFSPQPGLNPPGPPPVVMPPTSGTGAIVPQVMQIGLDPNLGPICAGPLGPGPCAAVQSYLLRLASPTQPTLFDPRQIQIVAGPLQGAGPQCSGPVGQEPCALFQQELLDAAHPATIPKLSALAQGQVLSAVQIATDCAQQAGVDVTNFASCTGGQIILRPEQYAVVDCATSTTTTSAFANCAAPHLGVTLSNDQKKLVGCATKASGDVTNLVGCAGDAVMDKHFLADEKAALACAQNNDDASDFAGCAATSIVGNHATPEQRLAIECAAAAANAENLARCAGQQFEGYLSSEQKAVVDCALRSKGETSGFLACAGSTLLEGHLSPEAKTALQCAETSGDDFSGFATCSASGILGQHVSPEAKIALACAVQSGGDYGVMATCAGANLFNMDMNLNPEQQIAVQCVVSTGGQPYAAAGCIATRLTARELVKCLSEGVGGHGCFGDTNDLVGKNGWTARTLRQIAGGPNSVVNNPSQIWGGNNSFVRNPSQIWGGDNSFVRNPSQLWGGNNSVFNNPSQLAPKPVQLGKIGNTRICLPWC